MPISLISVISVKAFFTWIKSLPKFCNNRLQWGQPKPWPTATEIFSVPKRRIFALPKIVRYRNKSGLQYIWMWFVIIKFGGRGGEGGWSQIKPITFGNELRTYDMIPNERYYQRWQIFFPVETVSWLLLKLLVLMNSYCTVSRIDNLWVVGVPMRVCLSVHVQCRGNIDFVCQYCLTSYLAESIHYVHTCDVWLQI